MKAILEIPAPESCGVCWFAHRRNDGVYCGTINARNEYSYKYIPRANKNKRADFCPLTIIEDDE